MDRRTFIAALAGSIPGLPLFADAQPTGKVHRIGSLQNTPSTTADAARLTKVFIEALEERGYVEGRNLIIERRYVEGRVERIPVFASELVQLDLEVIVVTTGDAGIRALKERTSTIPIVMAGASDPVRDGFATTLARPGGNITGVSSNSLDLIPKQLELLREAAPRVARVVYLYGRFGAGDATRALELQRSRLTAAKALGFELLEIEMPAPEDFDRASASMLRERGEAILLSPNNTNFILRHRISEFAMQHRLPAIGSVREQAAAGLLMSYGNSLTWLFRTTAVYVGKILSGAKPADLPVEQIPFELIVNQKTAKTLSITIPRSLLLRADEIIE